MRKTILAFSLLSATALAGCMENQDVQRAVVGAGLGCVAGEIIQNGKCVTGAAIGAAGGALLNDM
ncbi:YMGG-like glycine zipper-containing protein [Celeribacter sp.]|uniref:YMGG-like glycine zipper-containing protein n=1 Tax=Celeribacter sp. TaxID=1890673 RepID=UPI003A8CDA3A